MFSLKKQHLKNCPKSPVRQLSPLWGGQSLRSAPPLQLPESRSWREPEMEIKSTKVRSPVPLWPMLIETSSKVNSSHSAFQSLQLSDGGSLRANVFSVWWKSMNFRRVACSFKLILYSALLAVFVTEYADKLLDTFYENVGYRRSFKI